MEKKFIINTDKEVLEIREGNALPLREPTNVEITGLISSPFEYLKNRKDNLELKNCHLVVDRDKMVMTLIINEHNHYKDVVKGVLKLNPDFLKFDINTGKTRTTFELADFIKMSRPFFETKDKAMKISSELRNFKAKVDRDLQNKDDGRANKKVLMNQVVTSNIPESFKLNIPVFKGDNPQNFEVEIFINADDFSCSLVSPDANDVIIETRNAAIDEQLIFIKDIVPELLILEV